MQKNVIIHGNNVDVLKEWDDNVIDLTVTSPPYDNLRDYEGYTFEFESLAEQLYRVTKEGGAVVWVVGDATVNGNKTLTSFKQALHFQKLGFNMYDVIIYEKSGTAPPHKKRYFSAHEYMFVFTKGAPKTVNLLRDKRNRWGGTTTFGEVTRREKDGTLTNKGKKKINEYGVRTNVWRYNNGKNYSTKDDYAHQHPAIFPEKLAEDHILSWSDKGGVVLDPFVGSGTTAKMAHLNDREYIGIDISEKYCELARERVERATKQETLF